MFNQPFRVPVLNENNAIIEIWDHDNASRDDHIGTCNIDLSRVRVRACVLAFLTCHTADSKYNMPACLTWYHIEPMATMQARMYRTDRVQAPVISRRSGKQHGILSVSLTFESNAPAMPPTGYYAPAPASWPAPSPAYAAPPPAPAYYAAAPPPPQAPAYYPPPAQPAYAPAPQQSYAAQQMGYHTYASAPAPPSAPPAPGYGAPPAAGYYPSVPTTQQFYPGAALPTAGAPPPPMRFY